MSLTAKIKLVFQHQYHVGSGSAASGFVDKNIIKDYEGRLVIPASTFKGQLRYNATLILPILPWHEVCTGSADCTCIICRNLGKGGYAPGRLFFCDLIQENNDDNVAIKTGVAINRKTRTNQHQALFTLEAGSSPVSGNNAFRYFVGNIEGMIPANEADKIAALLYSSFKLTESIGGERSRGLGVIDHEHSSFDIFIGEPTQLIALERIKQTMREVIS